MIVQFLHQLCKVIVLSIFVFIVMVADTRYIIYQILKEENIMNNRKCLHCNEPIVGRADQKFCNDSCRSAHNNKQYTESNTAIKLINRILKKNYTILTTLNANGKTTVNKSYLHSKGYSFEHFTFTSVTRNNNTNYFCYDQGYREVDDNKLILVHNSMSDNRA